MRYNNWMQSIVYSIISTAIILGMVNITVAQVRSSSNYQLQSDSINVGGGFSSSTSYRQESSVGEIGTGRSTSTSYSLRAGYQQMQEVFISLANTGDVIMDTAIGGLTGGISNGSATFTVVTDSPSGYQLTIEAENNPAMQNGIYSINDYNEGAIPDLVFAISANEALFGLTAEGVDQAQAFYDNVGVCNSGSTNTSFACWVGPSTTPYVIAEAVDSNHPNGATTTVNFRVRVGGSAGVVSGVYTATSTVTALPL